jgi:quinol monooxygenase YgiN
MVCRGLLVRLQARHGMEDEVAAFLREALEIVNREDTTRVWFAIRLDLSTFGIFDAFETEEGRQRHLAGELAAVLMERAPALFVRKPVVDYVDIVAAKLPEPSFINEQASVAA